MLTGPETRAAPAAGTGIETRGVASRSHTRARLMARRLWVEVRSPDRASYAVVYAPPVLSSRSDPET